MNPIVSRSAAETEHLAATFSTQLKAGDVLALHGDLGAGKTCFIRGLAAGLGVTQPVSSPTYTLVNEYAGGQVPLFHIDLYRLHGVQDAWNVGIEEYIEGNGITAIEWAERAAAALPARTHHVYLRHGASADERLIEIKMGTGTS